MSSIDPLGNFIASVAADPPIAMIASVAAVILAVFWWVAFRRLTGMQMQIDELRRDIRGLEAEYSRLIVRQSNNLPKSRSRKARKLSSPSSDTLEETAAAPVQPDEKNSKEPEL